MKLEDSEIVERNVVDKVQDCVKKAVSALASQLGRRIDDCMGKIEGRLLDKNNEEQFWSVEEITGGSVPGGSGRKVT